MGCDIHFYVERRQADGSWKTADAWYSDEDGDMYTTDWSQGYGSKNPTGPFYSGRNYALFSILANVRNGYGFAGVDTGDGFMPISEPRGVPENSCPEYLAQVSEWGRNGHSHSYLTLDEVLSFDWTQTSKKRGFITPLEWVNLRVHGKPQSWSGSVSGSRITRHSVEDFDSAYEALREKHGLPENPVVWRIEPHLAEFNQLLKSEQPFARAEWVTPYYEAAGDFWCSTIPKLLALGEPKDTRLVFFFDN